MTTTYRPFRAVLDETLQDPSVRAEWDRNQLARDVSIWLLGYRKEHDLTQTALARQLGWQQPVVARLESGEHEPSISTLRHLVERLGMAATIEIDPEHVNVRFARRPRRVRTRVVPVASQRDEAVHADVESRVLQPA